MKYDIYIKVYEGAPVAWIPVQSLAYITEHQEQK